MNPPRKRASSVLVRPADTSMQLCVSFCLRNHTGFIDSASDEAERIAIFLHRLIVLFVLVGISRENGVIGIVVSDQISV